MIFYFGVRPTGNNLHLGHAMALLNMFNDIKDNLDNIDEIYFLMAEIHAEISSIDEETIRANTEQLANKILALLKTYLETNHINKINVLDKVKFIYQNDNIGWYHRDITYRYLPLANTNDVLSSPIYINSQNNSLAFLIYPILQAFDVLLYVEQNKQLVVYVAGDQRANINIMKDIADKLKIKNNISFNIYENVIYDYKCSNKMSKSLNNFINFDDVDNIAQYIQKYITFGRESKNSIGNYNECPFNTNIVSFLAKYLDLNTDHVELCNAGKIGCYECKGILLKKLIYFIEDYISNQKLKLVVRKTTERIAFDNYVHIKWLINKRRSDNENS